MRVAIIGAGKTGRGFLLRLLQEHEVILIDPDKALIAALRAQGCVNVSFFGDSHAPMQLHFASAMTWEEAEPLNADLILISVGGSNLADVGVRLRDHVRPGQRIIVCENATKPAQKLYDAIGNDSMRIAESTVFCTTIEDKGIDISSEWYPVLQYDAKPMQGELPDAQHLKPIDAFGDFLTRKLFTYNSASCIIAYLGYQKGYTVYSDAANDPAILSLLDRNYASINECMCREFGYDPEDQREFALLSRIKFTDKTIADTISRNAREPQRKIGRSERVTGPMLLQQKYGLDSSVLEMTLAAMLRYRPPQEGAWNALLEEKGHAGILKELAGLDENAPIFDRVLKLAAKGKIEI